MKDPTPLEELLSATHKPKRKTFWLDAGGSKWFVLLVGVGIGLLIGSSWDEPYMLVCGVFGGALGFVIGWRIDKKDAAVQEVREFLDNNPTRDDVDEFSRKRHDGT